MLGLPASVKVPALAATGGCATYSTLTIIILIIVPFLAEEATFGVPVSVELTHRVKHLGYYQLDLHFTIKT